MADNKLAHDFRGIGPEKIKTIEAMKAKGKLSNGYGCADLIEPVPNYWNAPCEIVNFKTTGHEAAKNNCWIILGRDRVDYPTTGYGGRGDTQAGAIYICAGMSSADPSEVMDHTEEVDLNRYPKDPHKAIENLKPRRTVRSPFKDASIMYLSQKTDVDNMFHLGGCKEEERFHPKNFDSSGWGSTAAGKMNLDRLLKMSKYHVAKAEPAQAAVAIKSDNVRVIGRNSIRIQVMGSEELSNGSTTNNTGGIALVGGGNPNSCQPAVLGYNLISSYRHLKQTLLDMKQSINLFMKQQMIINKIIATHEHANGPIGVTDQLKVFPIAMKNAMMVTDLIMGFNLSSLTGRIGAFESNYCEPNEKFILSKNVFHD